MAFPGSGSSMCRVGGQVLTLPLILTSRLSDLASGDGCKWLRNWSAHRGWHLTTQPKHFVVPRRHGAGARLMDLTPHRHGCGICAQHPWLFPSTRRTHKSWPPVPSSVGRVPSCWPLTPLISPSCIGPLCPGVGEASGAVLRQNPRFPTWHAQHHGSAFIFSAASLFSLQLGSFAG